MTRILRLSAFGLVSIPAVLLIIMFIGAWVYTDKVLHTPCQGDRASLEVAGFPAEPIEFVGGDGTLRRGWLTIGRDHPEVAIIVLPGHAGNTAHAVPDAAIFASSGYSTLIFEHRSCADPANLSATGILEAQDVLAAVDYLDTRSDIEHIGAHGISAGGTSALLAAADDIRIEAVSSAGGYTSLSDDVLDPPYGGVNIFDDLFRHMIVFHFRRQLGDSFNTAPADVIAQISPRPVFLIYADSESSVGEALYQSAADPKELWIVPNAVHSGYQQAAPDEYPERLVQFFETALGE